MIDSKLLMAFCAKPSDELNPSEFFLRTPFTHGGYKFYGNKHAFIALPIRDIESTQSIGSKARLGIERFLDVCTNSDNQYIELPEFTERTRKECARCRQCKGTGYGNGVCPIHIGNGIYIDSIKYLPLLEALPKPLGICIDRGPLELIAFRFPGGIGGLMPVRKIYS